jgi:hypothetical protein
MMNPNVIHYHLTSVQEWQGTGNQKETRFGNLSGGFDS